MAKKPEPAAAQQNTEQGPLVQVVDNLSKDYFMRKHVPWDEGGVEGQVVIKLGNGSVIAAEWEKLPPEMQKRCGYHGLSQKLGDSAAGFSKPRDFAGAYDAISAIYESLRQNSWNVKGDGASTADLAKALAGLKKCSTEAAEAAIAKMDEATLAKVKGHPEVKVKLAEIRTERAKAAAKAAKSEDLVIPGL